MSEPWEKKLLEAILEHAQKFETFNNDWKQHRIDAKEAMQKVGTIHSAMLSIAPNMSHLGQLPLIATTLKNMSEGLIRQNRNLTDGAKEDKKHQGYLLALVILILGITVTIIVLKESRKDLHIGSSGFDLTDANLDPKPAPQPQGTAK